jgi:hypothetical protein
LFLHLLVCLSICPTFGLRSKVMTVAMEIADYSIRLPDYVGTGPTLDWPWPSSTCVCSLEGPARLSRHQHYFIPLSPSGTKKSPVEFLKTQSIREKCRWKRKCGEGGDYWRTGKDREGKRAHCGGHPLKSWPWVPPWQHLQKWLCVFPSVTVSGLGVQESWHHLLFGLPSLIN